MARKRARLKRRCEQKVVYTTGAEAWAKARRMSTALVPMSASRCGKHWRIGHSGPAKPAWLRKGRTTP